MRESRLVARIAFFLAGVQLLVAVAMAVIANPEGLTGAALFAALYAMPLFLLGLGVRSAQRRWQQVARWSALVLAVVYSALLVANWSGYSAPQAAFALAVAAPIVAVDALIFLTVRSGTQQGPPLRPRLRDPLDAR